MTVRASLGISTPRALALALVLGGGGCAELDNRTTVEDLRVLASRADPPEVFIADFDDPGEVPAVTVSALVADPAGARRAVTGEVVACPYFLDSVTGASGGSAVLCKPLPPELKRDFPVTAGANGIEHTLSATITFDETTRALLPRAPETDRIYGMAVFVEWTITAGLDPAKEVVTALKRLRYTEPRPDWGQEPNRNPELTGIRFSGLYDAAANMLVNPIEGPAEVPLLLPVQQSVFVEPILADGAVETDYVTAVATSTSDPTPVWTTVARERLRFAFLATAGTFRPAVTSSELGPLREPGQTVFFASEYHLPGGNRRPADGRVTIWIVARDERGGVGWTRREIQLPP